MTLKEDIINKVLSKCLVLSKLYWENKIILSKHYYNMIYHREKPCAGL